MLHYIKSKITRKIFFGLALLISSSLLVGFFSLWNAQNNKLRLSNMFQQEVSGLEEADDIKSALYRIRSDSLEYLLAERETTRATLRKEINEQQARLKKSLQRLYDIGLNKQEKTFIANIKNYSEQYISMLENTLYQAVKRGKLTQAEKIARYKAVGNLRLARAAANDFMTYSVQHAKKRQIDMEKEYGTFMWVMFTGFLVDIIIALLILVYFQRNIAIPITQITHVMKKLAQRDWSVAIPVIERIDEVGNMVTAVNVFKENGVENERLLAVEVEKEKAEAKLAVQHTFVSNMNHELRTPMTSVLGFAQILQESAPALTKEQQDYVEHIIDKGLKLMELIEQVMTLENIENIENIKETLSIKHIQVDDLCRECLLLIKDHAHTHNIIIESKLDSGCWIHADETYLTLVIYNLLSNAVNYNRNGGTILLECNGVDEDKIRISVTDTGDGIAKNLQTKVFESFNRLGREGSNILGAGIGLTIAKYLVESMGGRIGVKSEVGAGSTFWIELPVKLSGKFEQ